jgi:hypothetical protein
MALRPPPPPEVAQGNRLPPNSLADRFPVRGVILLSFDVRPHIGWGHQTSVGLNVLLRELTQSKFSSVTGFFP